jgi:DNA primase
MRESIRELSDELDLEFWFDREGIRHKITRGSSGIQINAVECPSCGDRRSRVYLNADTGLGNCFVCNARFNKMTFAHAYYGGTWKETFNNIKATLVDQGWKPKRQTTAATEVPDTIRLPDSISLPTEDGKNLSYLINRGINDDMCRYFHLRYSQYGMFAYKKDGERKMQSFDERLIIPVFDLDGTLVTFQGRDLTGKSERKYLFPVGLPGTGRFLYNGQNANGSKRLVIGEGAFDVIAIKMALDEEPDLRDVTPVGSFGKHLSFGSIDANDQLGRLVELKRSGLSEVTIMWDGEHSALVAALAAADKIVGVGLKCKVAFLPQDKDPNEVEGEIVRRAFYEAKLYTKAQGVALMLNNPYKDKKVSLSFD